MIFDEPEAGIDLWSFAKLTETFTMLHAEQRRTILIISHQERIIRLADEITWCRRYGEQPGEAWTRSTP